ncbi:RES family NAD+ phosphorylase [Mesorhizobium sp. CN2-181]|uniref:RES family NAD+ phosphorylase n=1 Tax=Mesorhizobium yinganensis TaxID=3157707 RepID=UPI0032B7AE3C
MRVWRISNFADLTGNGGLHGEGRWHAKGVPIIYCADHPSTSLLEILVHANRQTVPDFYQLIEMDVPDTVGHFIPDIFEGWRIDQPRTRRIGMSFIEDGRFAMMKVPSVVMPRALNFIVNPLHRDAASITIVGVERYPFDSRLFA